MDKSAFLATIKNGIDPYRDKYFHWPSNYFPFNLPACSLERRQEKMSSDDETRITWVMDYNLELLCWVVSEDGRILHENAPRKGNQGDCFTVVHNLSQEALSGKIGITFIWAFFIPVPLTIPKHPMGIIYMDPEYLRGKNTIITIKETRKKQI